MLVLPRRTSWLRRLARSRIQTITAGGGSEADIGGRAYFSRDRRRVRQGSGVVAPMIVGATAAHPSGLRERFAVNNAQHVNRGRARGRPAPPLPVPTAGS